MTNFPPEEPFFDIRHSSSSIADIPVPKHMSIGGFCTMTGCTFDEAFLISIELFDGRRMIDLESRRAQVLMQRGRQN